MKKNSPILLIEDDQLDVLRFQRALNDLKITQPLQIATNGEDALRLLAEHEKNLPKIIVLDLNLPRMNGIELLSELKNHTLWRRIPVIVLTTSSQMQERIECFDLSVAGYIIKPLDYEAFVEVIGVICNYWCINELSG